MPNKKTLNLTEDENVLNVDELPEMIINGGTYLINQRNPNKYTHSYFKYPCKFIPEIPRWFINRELKEENGNVLDPFSGSGTSLVEAILLGHNAFGTEIDSLAKLLIKVKTTPISLSEIDFIRNWISSLVKNDNNIKKASFSNINNLNHWFSEENTNKLNYIKEEIEKIEKNNIKDFLNICFASIIRKSSNADDVSPKPYVSNRIKKEALNPFEIYPKVVKNYLAHMEDFSNKLSDAKVKSILLEGDALEIKTNITFDVAITSPPYINAFDYARTLRLENLWLDLETEKSILDKKKEYVGTENIQVKNEKENLSIIDKSALLEKYFYDIKLKDKRRALIVKKFFEDMNTNLVEVYNKLKPNGSYCVVIGNSNIRKTEIESWKIICKIAIQIGYEIDTYFSYVIQNRYLRIPRSGMGGKIKKDYVIVLRKPS